MSVRKVVRIGTSHYHVGHIVPAMVAKEMTYFEQEGLTNYALYHGGLIPAVVEDLALRRAMKEKGVDIVTDVKPNSVFQLARRGEDVFIVGCWRNRQDWQFFGAKGLKGLSDLKGKKIGTRDFGGISHRVLSFHLKRAGLDPEKDVVFVRGARFHPHERPEEALRSGEVDCINVLAIDNRGLDQEGYPLLLESRKVYAGGRPDRIIVATRRMVEEDADLLTAYLRATIRAYWYMMDYGRSRPYLEALVRRLRMTCLDEEEANRNGLEGGARLSLPFDGAPSVPGLEQMLAECQEMGEIEASFDLAPILRLEFVRRAFEDLHAREDLREQMLAAREMYDRRERAQAA
jgi:ABC-type nitrate/sulfonate/bicarbonate transport system substrate-binding protein